MDLEIQNPVNKVFRVCAVCLNGITHWVVDVVKALAGGEGVVGIDVFKPTDSQEHSNGRAKSKKRLRVESQLWVIYGNLWGEEHFT